MLKKIKCHTRHRATIKQPSRHVNAGGNDSEVSSLHIVLFPMVPFSLLLPSINLLISNVLSFYENSFSADNRSYFSCLLLVKG